MLFPASTWTLFLALPVLYGVVKLIGKRRRNFDIPHANERVLILGASSGIGRTIAHQYAIRTGNICVVGRREDKATNVLNECKAINSETKGFLGISADFSSAEDMVRVRTILEKEWAGLDTVIVAAGVSAIRPLLEVAGVDSQQNTDASLEGIQFAVNAAEAATRSNYIGPMVAAISLIPFLKRTSKSPSILLISSLGAVIPAPTRSIYGSTKSASLLLYQALAIEHPSVQFSFVLPSTVEGAFRASAVDQAPSNSQSELGPEASSAPGTSGLRVDHVARRCIQAVDNGEKVVFMPELMSLGHLLYWLWPSFIEKKAMKKYGFTAK